ncbi:hypothetical protein Pmani_034050 [Petrolisthes manimaculis]|uniref:BRCA1-A complex subunit Abraxas 1 n=1 Tax=Petrolisthes manimaculis TaxID=1843537 RepID=A0AAE1TPJ5_9EUCA|nr:hypothetical protein Pmani_034050 [Petrolisthes manimaculis]
MATTGVLVSCSGAVLSCILYEQLRRGHAQEGFLLGEVESHISEHISDSQICNEKTETIINLSSFLPCTGLGSFYSGAGVVNQEKLNQYLGSNYKRVMGWYRSRGSSCEDVYLREKLIHQQLEAVMAPHTGGNFLMALFSCRTSPDPATITTTHKFMLIRNNRLEGVPLRVVNIGDTSTSEYLLKPHNPSLYISPTVQGVLANMRQDEPGVAEVEKIHSSLVERLGDLLGKYGQEQDQMEEALAEVKALRAACAKHGIKPDFTPEAIQEKEEANLMNFEEPSQSPHTKTSRVRGKGTSHGEEARQTEGTGLGRGQSKARGRERGDSESSDAFGFVNTEMEKLQVRPSGRGIGSSESGPGVGLRSRSSTPSPRRLLQKSRSAGSPLQRNPPRRWSESGSDSSPGPLSKKNQDTFTPSPAKDSQNGVSRGSQRGRVRGRGSQSLISRSQSPGEEHTGSRRGGRGRGRRGQGKTY